MTKRQRTILRAIGSENKPLPPDTTTAELVSLTHHEENALFVAAAKGKLPRDVTAEQLAALKDSEGVSALHYATRWGFLPPNTTYQILANTKTNTGLPATDTLRLHYSGDPLKLLQNTEPTTFPGDVEIANLLVQIAIARKPSCKNLATIWLGHLIAAKTKHNP